MLLLHLECLLHHNHESWIFVFWTASFKVTKGSDLLVELNFIQSISATKRKSFDSNITNCNLI